MGANLPDAVGTITTANRRNRARRVEHVRFRNGANSVRVLRGFTARERRLPLHRPQPLQLKLGTQGTQALRGLEVGIRRAGGTTPGAARVCHRPAVESPVLCCALDLPAILSEPCVERRTTQCQRAGNVISIEQLPILAAPLRLDMRLHELARKRILSAVNKHFAIGQAGLRTTAVIRV